MTDDGFGLLRSCQPHQILSFQQLLTEAYPHSQLLGRLYAYR